MFLFFVCLFSLCYALPLNNSFFHSLFPPAPTGTADVQVIFPPSPDGWQLTEPLSLPFDVTPGISINILGNATQKVVIDCNGEDAVLDAVDATGVGQGGSLSFEGFSIVGCADSAFAFSGQDVNFYLTDMHFDSVGYALTLQQGAGGRAGRLYLTRVSADTVQGNAFYLQFLDELIATDVTITDAGESGIDFVNNNGEIDASGVASLTNVSCAASGSSASLHACVSFHRGLSIVWAGGSVSTQVGAALSANYVETVTITELAMSSIVGTGGIALRHVSGEVTVFRSSVSLVTCSEWNCAGISLEDCGTLQSLTVRDTAIDQIDANTKQGGGISVNEALAATVVLDNVNISNCVATGGAGVSMRGLTSFTMLGGRVDDNTASTALVPRPAGGGLNLDECGTILIDGTSFSRNAAHFGQAINVWGFHSFGTIHESVTVRNVAVVNHTCLSDSMFERCSGAIDIGRSNDIVLESVTVAGSKDLALAETAGLSLAARRSLVVRDTLVVDSSSRGPCGINVFGDQIDDLDGTGQPAPLFTVLLEDVTFERLQTSGTHGGGLLSDVSNATLRRVVVRDCASAGLVGGLEVAGRSVPPSVVRVEACTFEGNAADGDCGGLSISDVTTTSMVATTFTSNSAGSSGGALCVDAGSVDGSSIAFADCTFHNNMAHMSAGAVGAYQVGTLSDVGSTFTSNIAMDDGGAFELYDVVTLTLSGTRFDDCHAMNGNGGAVVMWGVSGGADPHNSTWSNVEVYNGGAQAGGCAHYTGSNYRLHVTQSLVRGNTAYTQGGAFSLEGSGANTVVQMSRSTLLDNVAAWRGGALAVESAVNLTLDRCNLLRNGQSLLRFFNSPEPVSGQDVAFISTDGTLTLLDSVLDGTTGGVPPFFDEVGQPLRPLGDRAADAAPIYLAYSTMNDRSNPQPLHNATITENDFIFLAGLDGLDAGVAVHLVHFYSAREGKVREDVAAPWDFGGGSNMLALQASGDLDDGFQTVFALTLLSDWTLVVPRADFRVGSTDETPAGPVSPRVASRVDLSGGHVEVSLTSSCVCAGPDATWTSYAVECESGDQSLRLDGPLRFADVAAACDVSFGSTLSVAGCDATSGCQLGDFALASVPEDLVPVTPAPPTPIPPTPGPPTPAPPTPAPADGNGTATQVPSSSPAGGSTSPSPGDGAVVDDGDGDSGAGLIAALVVLALLTLVLCIAAGLLARRLLKDAAVRRDTVARPSTSPVLAEDVVMEDIEGGSFADSSSSRSLRNLSGSGHGVAGGSSSGGGSEYARIATTSLDHSDADSAGYVRVGAPLGSLPGTGTMSNYDSVNTPLSAGTKPGGGESEYSLAPAPSDGGSQGRSQYSDVPPPRAD